MQDLSDMVGPHTARRRDSAASVATTWLVPGITMEKEYRIYKKEQALANV
jgi:hypothetical protein